MSQLMQLGEALALPAKSRADILCRLETCEMKTGPKSTYFNCKVTGGGGQPTSYLNVFGNTPAAMVGKMVVLRYCEIDEWQGRKRLSMGRKNVVEEYHDELDARPQASPRPTQRPPEAPRTAPVGQPAGHVHGATVGGALARAVEIWIAGQAGNPAGWNSESAGNVERITRDLVAIQQRVESGAPVPEPEPF